MNPIDLRITRLAHGRDLPLPSYQTEHAAGMDLVAAVPADAPLTLAPGSRALAKAIAGALQGVPVASLQGDTIVFVGTQDAFASMAPAATRAGVNLRFVDATMPYPGKVEPEAVPDWFDEPRN